MRISQVIGEIEISLYIYLMFWFYPLEDEKDQEFQHLVKYGICANHRSPGEI